MASRPTIKDVQPNMHVLSKENVMRLSEIIGKVAAVLVLVSAATLMPAQNDVAPWNFPDLSATQVIQSEKFDMPMKVWRSGSSVRVERSAAWSSLYVPSTGKVYNLTSYPDGSHQCVVMRPDQARMIPSPLELLN